MKKIVGKKVKTKKGLDITQRDVLCNEFFKFLGCYFRES